MKPNTVIAGLVLLMLVLLGAYFARNTSQLVSKNTEFATESQQSQPQNSQAAIEEAKAVEERTAIEKLIMSNDEFAVCRTYNFTVQHHIRYAPPNLSYQGEHEHSEEYYLAPVSRALNLLVRLGYVRLGESTRQNDWMPLMPTSKGLSAIGTDIRQEHTRAPDLEVVRISPFTRVRAPVKNGTCSMEETQRMMGDDTTCEETFSWSVMLGCREFIQIDGVTPLADGQKVDFSWRWHPTELGTADGLVDSRQRAEAYFRKTSGGWVMDKVYFKE